VERRDQINVLCHTPHGELITESRQSRTGRGLLRGREGGREGAPSGKPITCSRQSRTGKGLLRGRE
jgi:hypothetical protein